VREIHLFFHPQFFHIGVPQSLENLEMNFFFFLSINSLLCESTIFSVLGLLCFLFTTLCTPSF